MGKRLKSKLYMDGRLRFDRKAGRFFWETLKDGRLFADGKYPTKITAEDMPEWYIRGPIRTDFGFISAKGVRKLVYSPNYITNHLYKDDLLFVSYEGSSRIDEEFDKLANVQPVSTYKGYDIVLSGSIIVDFAKAAGIYSNIDCQEIIKAMEDKSAWYDQMKREKTFC